MASDQDVVERTVYVDHATGVELTPAQVLERTVFWQDADGQQLTGDRVSDTMLSLSGIDRLLEWSC